MRVLYPWEMQALDREAITGGIPSLDLMERAGRAVAENARDMLGLCAGRSIAVVAAKGNNGGDGFVAARYLRAWGAEVSFFLIGEVADLTADSEANYRRFIEEGGVVKRANTSALKGKLPAMDLVVDAIFGVGFKGKAEGVYGETIEAVNASPAPVLAVDLPSGMEADSGAVNGPAVKADRTVTFAWPKTGLYLFPGAEGVGELVVVDIGIPAELLDVVVESRIETVDEDYVAGLLPARSPHAHKGVCGRVLVVAGSIGLTGAAALCSRSALRAGAGVVTLGIPEGLNSVMEIKLTEVMTLPLPDIEGRYLSEEAVDVVVDEMQGYDVLALGPGLGTRGPTREAVYGLLMKVDKPVILDADGINSAAVETRMLEERRHPTVITPHPGELGRLLGKKAGEVQSSRIDSAMEASGRFGCTVVLKGANTIIAESGGVYINPLALPGLATAGSGDVLTGCVAALCAQGMNMLEASTCGVYIHGKAAELAAHLVGPIGMVAGDVVSHLPLALAGLSRAKKGGSSI